MIPHRDTINHDERCETCGSLLDLRFIGEKDWVFYCSVCLKHDIRLSQDIQDGDVHK